MITVYDMTTGTLQKESASYETSTDLTKETGYKMEMASMHLQLQLVEEVSCEDKKESIPAHLANTDCGRFINSMK